MSVNDRMTNERLKEWENHFKEVKRREESLRLKNILQKGTVMERSLGDYDIRLNCIRSNASEEIVVQYDNKRYYLTVENEICDDQIILCGQVEEVNNEWT